jgi:signal transduction histidine kinase
MLSAFHLRRLHRLSLSAAIFVVAVGGMVLLGWWGSLPMFYRLTGGLPQVEPTSAVAFMLTGAALYFLQPITISPLRRAFGWVLAVLGCLLGFLTLLEYAHWLPNKWLEGLLADFLPCSPPDLKMSPHTALIFTLTNIALLLLGSNRGALVRLTQWSAFLGVMALVGVFLGYAYGEDVFFNLFGQKGMALHAATTFTVLGWGIVLARPEQGFFRIVAADTAGGALSRRGLFLIALFPILLGWLPLLLASMALTHREVESVLATVLVFIAVVIMIRLAYRLHEQELQYRQVQEDVRQHQTELAHVSRLNTMGEMASGLAHELNQPLAAVANYAGACQRMIQSGQAPERLLEPLAGIQKQALRASEIIRRLRAFVRKQQPQKLRVSLDGVIHDALLLVKHQANRMDVPLLLEVRQGLPPVAVDAIQIEQVILNIVQNSIDAMQVTPSHLRQILLRAFVNTDGLLQVDVRDTGPGMDDELKTKVFDAFVTTKGDRGMGIGLALCRSIIEAHGGRLWVESGVGKGTTFSFTLPVD